MENEPAIAAAGNIAQETGGNLATVVTNTTGIATATNQTTMNTNLSSIVTNTTGSATAANQTTGNTSLSTLAGAVTSAKFQDNISQINGVTPLMGNGTTGTGSLRVTLASDTSSNTNAFLVTGTGGTFPVSQSTASNLNAQVVGNTAAGGADLGNGVKTAGVYNTTLPTYTNGQRGDMQVTANGSLQTNLNTLIAGEDLTNNKMVVEQRNVYSNVTATGTTTVKSGANFLHGISINNPSALLTATTATTIVLYDNTAASGTKIATISLPLSANIAGAQPFFIPYDVSLTTGLTIVITLGTGGSWTPDLTINTRT